MGKMWVGLGVGMVLVGQSPETEAFLAQAKARHGDLGARAAAFLVSGMPEADRRILKADFLMEHLDLALGVGGAGQPRGTETVEGGEVQLEAAVGVHGPVAAGR